MNMKEIILFFLNIFLIPKRRQFPEYRNVRKSRSKLFSEKQEDYSLTTCLSSARKKDKETGM